MTQDTSKNANKQDFASGIRNMFDSIAQRYDLANHLLSAGTDFLWRKLAVKLTNPKKGEKLLDMCCGTGDLAIAYAKYGKLEDITGADFSEEMIRLAKQKQQKLANKAKLPPASYRWQTADCTATPYKDETYDIISCGFGVRNMADLNAGLAEMARLLKPSGRVCILEFSLPKCKVLRPMYLLYLRYILPIFGAILTGKLSAYRYFADSILKWDKEVDLPAALESAGLKEVTVKPLSKGIATIYVFEKP